MKAEVRVYIYLVLQNKEGHFKFKFWNYFFFKDEKKAISGSANSQQLKIKKIN